MITVTDVADIFLSALKHKKYEANVALIELEHKVSVEELAEKWEYRGVDMTYERFLKDYTFIEHAVSEKLRFHYTAECNELIRKYSSSVAAADKTIASYNAEIEKLSSQSEKLVRQCDYIDKCHSVVLEKSPHISDALREIMGCKNCVNFAFDRLLEYIDELRKLSPGLPVSFYSSDKPVSITEYKVSCYYTEGEFGRNREPQYLSVKIQEPDSIAAKLKMKLNKSKLDRIKYVISEYNREIDRYYAEWAYFESYKPQNEIKAMRKRARTLLDEAESINDKAWSLQKKSDSDAKILEYLKAEDSINALIAKGYISGLSDVKLQGICNEAIKACGSAFPFEAADFFDPYTTAPKSAFRPDDMNVWRNDRIEVIVNGFIDRQKSYHTGVDDSISEKERKIAALNKVDLNSLLSELADIFPLYFQTGLPSELTQKQAARIIDNIRICAEDQYSLTFYPSPVVSEKEQLYLPDYVPVVPDEYFGTSTNLVIRYKGTDDSFKTVLNRTLFNIMLSVPVEQAKLRIIDLGATNMASLYTTRLHPSLFNNEVILGEHELRAVVTEWQDRLKRISRKCENITKYNEEHHTWLEPYEVVVVLGYPKSLSPSSENLIRPFVENGHKAGFTFIFGVQTDVQPSSGQTLLADERLFKFIDCDLSEGGFPFSYTPFADNPVFLSTAFEYLNGTLAKNNERPAAVQKTDDLLSAAYSDVPVSDISVPVGLSSEGPVNFRLDTVSHLHAFILGQSGTGKSRFLHNIIGNILLHYSPSQVELYLLDLKLGGVEFNPYKDEKHVRALLVDNNDRQVTLEILRELESKMEERSKEFARIGVRNLEMYNKKSETMMPQLVLVIDECQMLFTERPDNIEKEIRQIISLTAKQGRSQGVHMIFSTQTFMNSAIPIDELQGAGLTDMYLLNCDRRDSEKLVKNSSSLTAELKTGEIYYHHHQNSAPDVQFNSYYVDDDKQEAILEGAKKKTASFHTADQYYFSGKMQALLDASVLEQMQKKARKNLCISLGTMLDLNHGLVSLSLKEEQGENLLVLGLNQHRQATRTAVEAFLSAVYFSRQVGRDTRFVVIDCMPEDDNVEYQEIFDALEDRNIVSQMFGRDRGKFLKDLSDKVRNGSADETIVLVLGQEKWRELKNDKALEDSSAIAEQGGIPSYLGSGLGRGQNRCTYRSELKYLLEHGSEYGVHFIIQVDKPQNLLAEQMVSRQMVTGLFRHWIMLKSPQETGMLLRLRDDISLERLSDDTDRLRAVYYSDDADSYRLFTPFCQTTMEENEKFM